MIEKPATVEEIVKEWLKEHGYDGLYDDYECGCVLDDFMPCCDSMFINCKPGYKVPCDPETSESGFDYMIMAEKPKEKV